MEITNITSSLANLISFWKDHGIQISQGNTLNEIKLLEDRKGFKLPDEFIQYFLKVNGMESLYPNYFDGEGFLFYPLNAIVTLEEEFSLKEKKTLHKCFLFAEYMHKSWWYGVHVNLNSGVYTIGIIPEESKFKAITNSLSDFIRIYLNNDPVLYDYE